MKKNNYYVDHISRERYQSALESCRTLFPNARRDEEIYVGGGVIVTKAGRCSVEVWSQPLWWNILRTFKRER